MKFGQRIPVINTSKRFIKSIPDAESWARLCKTVATNGLVVPLNDISDRSRLDTYLNKDPNADWYTSVYHYPSSAKSYYEENNHSLKGYSGEATTNRLIFDFDSKGNIEDAKQDTIELLYRLSDKGVDIEKSASIFFSGCKGFHVEVPTLETFNPEDLKIICSNLAAGLNTFDTVIYNTTRLLRIPNTKHQTTGVYKIQLEPIDLQQLTVEQIVAKAATPGPLYSAEAVQNTEFLNEYKKKNVPAQSVAVDVEEVEGIRGINTIDWSTMPKNMPRCFYALEQGIMVPGQGERNHLFLRLAAYYRNQGYNKEKAYNSLKATARLNARLYPEAKPYDKSELWHTVISSVYSNGPGWKPVAGSSGVDPNNVMIKKYCDALNEHTNCKCSLHTKSATQTLMKIDEVADGFQRFAEDFDNNLVHTGIEFIDDHMKIARGTTTLLAGVSGSGKTTAALNMIEKANALGQHVVFFSMDMYKNLVYLKIAQKLTRYSQDEIISFYKTKNGAKVKEIRDLISKVYDKTHFEFSSTMRIEEVRDTVLRIEESTGNKISLVVVDYAGRLGGPHTDKYANASYNALKSKEVAEQTNAAWLFLVQVARASGDGCTPLRSKRVAKESSDWEDSATNIITMWRPFLGDPERDDIVRMFLAKNRMGSEVEAPLRWDGAKSLIRDLDDLETEEYNTMRGSKEEKEYLKARQSKGLL